MLFSSDDASVWDPKRLKELLCIPKDQLKQLHNIPVWSKDISNSQDKDRTETSVQNSQCFGLESQLSSTKSKENQDICLKSSVSFNQHPQCQNLQVSKLYRSKIKSVSLSDLSEVVQDLPNTNSLKHTLSLPNICKLFNSKKFYISETSIYKPVTYNTKTMEVITQLNIDVSTHVKKGETNFEIIQEKREEFGDKETAVNACESNNKNESAENNHSIQIEESNSPTASCDKMELDPTHVKEIANNVDSLSDKNESLHVNGEKCNAVELNAASIKSCDKIESDPIVEPTVSDVESFQDKNQQPLQVNEEKTNDIVKVNAVTPILCDKIEVDHNAKEALTDDASTSDKTNIHVNEAKSNETAKLDVSTPSSCDKMESDFSAIKQIVAESTNTSIKIHKQDLDFQNMDEKQETSKQAIESSNNIVVPKEQSAVVNVKKTNVLDANLDLCNSCATEKIITNMPCQEFATSNVPNKIPVEKTVGKKRKLETKSKISKKRKNQEKQGQVDTRSRVPKDIHYSQEEIETLLDIIKQFL